MNMTIIFAILVIITSFVPSLLFASDCKIMFIETASNNTRSKDARKCLSLAANGNIEAQYKAGLLFQKRGMIDKALIWFENAAIQNHNNAKNSINTLAQKGNKKAEKSLALLINIKNNHQLLKEYKNRPPLYYLIQKQNKQTSQCGKRIYDIQINSIKYVDYTPDDNAFNKLCKSEADSGNAEAQFYWGQTLITQSRVFKAMAYLEKSAQQGYTEAQYLYPMLALRNLKTKEILGFLKQAADKGHEKAKREYQIIMHNLEKNKN